MAAGPTSFVGFDELMGLNEGVGDSLATNALGEADRLQASAKSAADAEYDASRAGGAWYKAAQETSRKATASYGEFMKALNDPAARAALLEKSYGPGGASRLNEMLFGGSSRLRQEQGEVAGAEGYAKERSAAGVKMDAEQTRRRAETAAEEERYNAEQERRRAAREALMKQRAEEAEDRRIADFVRWRTNGKGAYNPGGQVGPGDAASLGKQWGFGDYTVAPGTTERDVWRGRLEHEEAARGHTFENGGWNTAKPKKWGDVRDIYHPRQTRTRTGDVRDIYDPNRGGY